MFLGRSQYCPEIDVTLTVSRIGNLQDTPRARDQCPPGRVCSITNPCSVSRGFLDHTGRRFVFADPAYDRALRAILSAGRCLFSRPPMYVSSTSRASKVPSASTTDPVQHVPGGCFGQSPGSVATSSTRRPQARFLQVGCNRPLRSGMLESYRGTHTDRGGTEGHRLRASRPFLLPPGRQARRPSEPRQTTARPPRRGTGLNSPTMSEHPSSGLASSLRSPRERFTEAADLSYHRI